MARQEQQQRRNSKSSSSSSISGRQHQQRQLQLQLPPSFTAMVFPCPGPTFLQQPAGSQYYTIYSLRFSRMYSLGFSRISEDTLGTFLLRFGAIFGTKLGGVLLFRVSFEKDVWLLVSRLGGWLMARQEQQQRRNSKSSSSISGRQHQQRQLQLPPSFTAILRHFWHEIRWCFAVSSEFRKRCLAVGFSPWRLVDGTAGAAAAQEQQEQQQQQHQRTTAPAAAAAAASVLHCYGVSLSGTHVFCSSQQAASTIYIA